MTLALLTVPFYRAAGLRIAWGTVVPGAVVLATLGALTLYMRRTERTGADRAVTDTVGAAFLVLLATNLGAPAQYLAVRLNRPLADDLLAGADAALGISVPALAAWTAARPVLVKLLAIAYDTLQPQIIVAILLLGLVYRDRERLSELCFHFHFCLIATLAGLAVAPAACAFQHYGFASTIDQTRFIAQFNALRAGAFHVIRFDDLEGLISMPSFHVAGGLMVAWTLRGRGALSAAVAALNAVMIASTILSGAHYFVDVPASFALFALSVAAWRAVQTSTSVGS